MFCPPPTSFFRLRSLSSHAIQVTPSVPHRKTAPSPCVSSAPPLSYPVPSPFCLEPSLERFLFQYCPSRVRYPLPPATGDYRGPSFPPPNSDPIIPRLFLFPPPNPKSLTRVFEGSMFPLIIVSPPLPCDLTAGAPCHTPRGRFRSTVEQCRFLPVGDDFALYCSVRVTPSPCRCSTFSVPFAVPSSSRLTAPFFISMYRLCSSFLDLFDRIPFISESAPLQFSFSWFWIFFFFSLPPCRHWASSSLNRSLC